MNTNNKKTISDQSSTESSLSSNNLLEQNSLQNLSDITNQNDNNIKDTSDIETYIPNWKFNSNTIYNNTKLRYKQPVSLQKTLEECLDSELKTKQKINKFSTIQYTYNYSRIPIMIIIFLLVILNLFRQQQIWYKSLNINIKQNVKTNLWEDIKLISKTSYNTINNLKNSSTNIKNIPNYNIKSDNKNPNTNFNQTNLNTNTDNSNSYINQSESSITMTNNVQQNFLKLKKNITQSRYQKFLDDYKLYLKALSCSLYAPWSGYYSSNFKLLPHNKIIINYPPYLFLINEYYAIRYKAFDFLSIKKFINKVFTFLKITSIFQFDLTVKIPHINYLSHNVDGYYYLAIDARGKIKDPIFYLPSADINKISDMLLYYEKQYGKRLFPEMHYKNNEKIKNLYKGELLWSINNLKDLSLIIKILRKEIYLQISRFKSNQEKYLVYKIRTDLSHIYFTDIQLLSLNSSIAMVIKKGLESCIDISKPLKIKSLHSLAIAHKNKLYPIAQTH